MGWTPLHYFSRGADTPHPPPPPPLDPLVIYSPLNIFSRLYPSFIPCWGPSQNGQFAYGVFMGCYIYIWNLEFHIGLFSPSVSIFSYNAWCCCLVIHLSCDYSHSSSLYSNSLPMFYCWFTPWANRFRQVQAIDFDHTAKKGTIFIGRNSEHVLWYCLVFVILTKKAWILCRQSPRIISEIYTIPWCLVSQHCKEGYVISKWSNPSISIYLCIYLHQILTYISVWNHILTSLSFLSESWVCDWLMNVSCTRSRMLGATVVQKPSQ